MVCAGSFSPHPDDPPLCRSASAPAVAMTTTMLRVIVFLGVDVWPTLNGLSSVMIAVLVLVFVPCPSAWVAPFVAYGSSRRIAFSGTPVSLAEFLERYTTASGVVTSRAWMLTPASRA